AFDAVAKNQGLQKKIGGTTISIVVIDSTGTTSDCTTTNTCPPVTVGRPAAPAVANALLNTVDGLASSCQKVFKGKNWRGDVISTIAHNMPTPESVKDDLTLYPTDADWVAFVKSSLGNFSGLY